MADDETSLWIKDKMVESAAQQAVIIEKLDQGGHRMTSIEGTLSEVMEATSQFPAMKMSLSQIEDERERLKQQKLLDTQNELQAIKLGEIKRKEKFGDRAYDVFIKALPFLLLGAMFIYSHIKDQL